MAPLLNPASQALRFNADHRHRALTALRAAAFRCSSYYFNQDPSSGRNPKLKSKPSSSSKNLELVIDLDRIKRDAVLSFESAKRTSEYKLRRFVNSGMDAFDDLRTMVVVDDGRRIVLSCRRSTVEFIGSMVLWSIVVWLGMRMLMEVGLGFKRGLGFGGGQTVRRRDRSLGGREVVVAASAPAQGRKVHRNESPGSLVTPLSLSYDAILREYEIRAQGRVAVRKEDIEFMGGQSRIRREEKLPSWMPISVPQQMVVAVKEEGQRMANRLIRAIMDAKVGGRDVCKDDIIELRRICRASGARVNINTTNARDSLYRTSVDFVLDICSRMPSDSISFQIDGEDPRQFIAGLAENFGIKNIRAARMVAAAVAAHTRSCFVQAWALEMQKNHMEAVAELSKICILHQIFPPEESSPEMEMVARGLEHHLSVENRQFLLSILVGICGIERCGSMAEALGLELMKSKEAEQETPPSQN